MPVPEDLRLFMRAAALLFLTIGLTWIMGAPRYGSVFGFRFVNALKSQGVWQALHRRIGWLGVLLAAILAVPLETVESTLYWQISTILVVSIGGVFLIRRRVGA
jgi:hypothetical protein